MKDTQKAMNESEIDICYIDPIVESFTYVSQGIDHLRNYDSGAYRRIKTRQNQQEEEMSYFLKDIRSTAKFLGLLEEEVDRYIDQFLQKFPFGLGRWIAWDDANFIFLYILIKKLKPKVIIETGCNVGFSSSFIALAVKENNNDCKFYTIDASEKLANRWEDLGLYTLSKQRRQEINMKRLCAMLPPKVLSIVPPDLREHIIFIEGLSKDVLPPLLQKHQEIDIFFHDSEHSYRNMMRECGTVLPYLKKGGYILAHDINLNSAFNRLFADKGGVAIGGNHSLGVFEKKEFFYSFDNDNLLLPQKNSEHNNAEFCAEKISLDSFPKSISISLFSDCKLHCVFCPNKAARKPFDILDFKKRTGCILNDCFARTERFVFKFYGDAILLPDTHELMRNIQESFPEADRVFYLHGEYVTDETMDILISTWGRQHYKGKNYIHVVLPASNDKFYRLITRSERFLHVIAKLKKMIEKRSNRDLTPIKLIFVATTLNIDDLPDFVRFANNLGVDKAACYYSYIYNSTQKYLSCFFKQELTNKMLDEAESLARKSNISIDLPPRFGLKEYPKPNMCHKPFNQIMFDNHGHILPCDASEDCNEALNNGKDFMQTWNSPYYQNLRKSLIDGTYSCFKHCIRANPASVNDFKSHVVYRNRRRDEDINVLWGDNF